MAEKDTNWKSRLWTMNKTALENELNARNVPVPTGATREHLRNLLRRTLSKEPDNDRREDAEVNPHNGNNEGGEGGEGNEVEPPNGINGGGGSQESLASSKTRSILSERDSSREDPRRVRENRTNTPNSHEGRVENLNNHGIRTIDPPNRHIRTSPGPINHFQGLNRRVQTRGRRNESQGTPRPNQRSPRRFTNHDLLETRSNADRPGECLAEKIRKWGVTYNGTGSVLDFLERIEELSFTYEIPLDQLVPCLPMLLKGKAILWYRNNRRDWYFWEEFVYDIRQYFLPVNINRQLEEDIRNRTQGTKENAHDFITAIQTLIRRYGAMSKGNEVERIYNNLRPDYRRYIRRHEVSTVADLIRLTNEYELIVLAEKSYKPPPPSVLVDNEKNDKKTAKNTKENLASVNNTYSRFNCCWRCGKRGHCRDKCTNPYKKFCSWCGKDNISFRDCDCPKSENTKRADARRPEQSRPVNRILTPGEVTESVQ